jgi:hypothetical protein
VLRRPLPVLCGLTLGDYLLWNWSLGGSLSGNRDVVALASGLTLPPLAIACLWLLGLSLARLIARSARRPRVQAATTSAGAEGNRRHQGEPTVAAALDEAPAPATSSARSTGKLAA